MRLDEILEVALQEIVSSTEVDGAECHLRDEEGKLALRMVYGLDAVFAEDSLDFRFSVGEGIPGRAFERREPVYVSNAQTDKHYWRRELAKAAGYSSLLCIPILGSKGLLGTFMLYSREPREFPSEMQTLMMTVGGQLAAAVNNAQMYDAQQQLASHQTTLYETLETIGEHLDPETVIQTAVEKVAELTGWPVVNILIPDMPGVSASKLVTRAWGGPESHDYREFEIPIHGGITGRAYRANQTQNVGDVSVDPDYIERDAVIKSELAVPLRHGDRTLGVLDIQSKRLNGFKEEDVLLVESLADAIALTLENANLFTQAQTEIRERIAAEQALRELNESLENRVEERTEALQKSLEQLEVTLDSAILSMARIIELRDPYTAGHQTRTAKLAGLIAVEMGLEKDQITGLKKAAIIHDVGKINTPTEILSKPGKLTESEFEIIREHVRIGEEIVSIIEFPWPVAEIISQHHERMDGSGYPKGLKGDEICMEARIIAVADVVEAMVSDRPYRQALDILEALEEIKKNAGKLYDKQVVKICLELFRKKKFTFES
jgi:putative nucleotidyltransferase with HDIG domain